MSIPRRREMSGTFVGSLAGLGAALLALPIMLGECTLVFWLTLGLASGVGLGFIRDIWAAKPYAEADGIDGKPRASADPGFKEDILNSRRDLHNMGKVIPVEALQCPILPRWRQN